MSDIILKCLSPELFSPSKHSHVWNQDICFESGGIYEIYAPSGTGKTSLIHMLYGLNFHYTGTIKIGRHTLKQEDLDNISLLRQTEMSIQFQDIRLSDDLSCRDNILLKSRLCNDFNEDELETKAEKLGVTKFWHKKPKKCSQGEQQRAGLVRALSMDYSILLMDEPFSNLDPDNIQKAWDLIHETKKHDATIIITSLRKEPWLEASRRLHL